MQPEIGYIETIQAEQVLTAMQQMGWQPGIRPPGYAAIQARLRQLFGNGGDGNRMRELREVAIRLATGQPVGHDDQEQADLPPLPEEIQQELQAMATGFEQQLTRLDRRLSQRLDSVMGEINADARTKIDTNRRDADERLAAANDELDQALTDLQAASMTISILQAELATTRETTAKTNGRLEALEQDLAAKSARIIDFEGELTRTKSETDTVRGRADAVEADLVGKTTQLNAVEQQFALAKEALATTSARVESLENELHKRSEQLKAAEHELLSTREAAAHTTGRLEVLEQELATKSARISDLEARLTETTTAMATATGRAEILEQELAAARAQTRKGAKP